MLDGLKPSNRKVLCPLFKNNQKVTVEQLSFDVSKSCGYHHSQEKTIIGMAQDFVGSPNNINLLEPDGQFGSRFSGGTDASNPKYISTNLSAMARVLFPKDDDFHLQCLIEDGKYIEPSNYLPVIPTILVNGAKGIGSAWSTFVPKYNPREIVENIRRFLNGEGMRTMDPWYRNFKGTIQKVKPKEGASEEGPCTYKLSGIFKKINETTIVITELPIGKWTRKYLRFLQDLKKKDLIQGFKNDSDDKSINITITLTKEKMKEVSHKGIQKNFKLSTAISTWNMNLLQIVGSLSLIKRYNTPKEILEDFTVIRLQAYEERRKEMLKKLKPEVCKIEDKLAFIRGLLSGEIQMNANIIRTLEEKEFVPFPHNAPGSYEYLFEGLMAMMTNPAN